MLIGRCALRVLVFLTAIVIPSWCEPQPPECFVDFFVYDPVGNRLATRLVDVLEADKRRETLLTLQKDGRDAFALSGHRLQFQSTLPLPSQNLIVKLLVGNERTVYHTFVIGSCKQRVAITSGSLDSGIDSYATIVTGRLVGCRMTEEYWVKAVPMFGFGEEELSHDGVIALSGEFEIIGSFAGKRHIILIGRGKEPLLFATVNIVLGGENRLDVIDGNSVCHE